MSYEIYAHHAHVFPANIKPEGTIEKLLETMDTCGIEKAVCFATFPKHLKEENEETNLWLSKELKGQDRLIGFGAMDFDKPDLAGQVRRIADFGFQGIKLHPAFQKFAIDGEKAFEVYAEAEKHDLMLSFHTGVHWHRIRDYQVWRFDEIAYNFPKLRFSMEHVGGYCFFNEGVAVMLNNWHRGQRPRIFAGLTSVFDPDHNCQWHLSDDRIRELIWQTGDQAAFFGLDFPYNDAAIIKAAIDHLANMDLPEESKRAIFSGNIRRELKF